MTEFKLRGKSYAIENTATFGAIVDECLKGSFTQISQMSKGAFVMSRACPSIPKDIVSWNSDYEFTWTISEKEFIVFSSVFSVALLEKQFNETNSSAEKGIITQRLNSIKTKIANLDKEMNRAIAAGLLAEVEALDLNTLEVSAETVSEVEQPQEDPEEAELLAKLQKIQAGKK